MGFLSLNRIPCIWIRFYSKNAVCGSSKSSGRSTCKIGIIGGSGFNDPKLFENRTERRVTTIYGDPSDVIIEGSIKGVPVALLARHGRKHDVQPCDVNFRANIWALKEIGCTHVLATNACGSLQEEYMPGDLAILDDVIDRTWGRKSTFFDRTPNGPLGVCHLPMRPAFCEHARQALLQAAKEKGYKCHERATCVCIQGPRFSTRAESLMYRQWCGHVINMTIVPEVVLAKEAGLSYASIAIITDYDCWRENEMSVSVSEVLNAFAKNVSKAKDVVISAVEIIGSHKDYSYLDKLKELVANSNQTKQTK